MHGNAHSKANRPYRTTISEAQIGLQKRYPNPASSFQLNLKRYISGNVKPKSGFKKRARKCFEKPPKKRCISRVRYTFKLPSMAKLSASKYQICASGAHADALMHLKPFQVEPTMLFFKHTSTIVHNNKTYASTVSPHPGGTTDLYCFHAQNWPHITERVYYSPTRTNI